MKELLKRIYLKYIVGYGNPENYWNKRWQINCEVEKGSEKRRKQRFSTIKNLMQKNECENILEVGCGKARFRELPGYLGLDFSLEALKKSGLQNFVHADITKKIPLPDKNMDAVLSMWVLLHVPFDKIECAVAEISRVTKKLVVLYEPWSLKPKHSQPHCFSHNLPELFKKHFDGVIVFPESK